MVHYNFKKIGVVPGAEEFIDIVLTRTQRKTPTVVHPGYAISRIRKFYMRKVKFTQQTVNEKLSLILEGFPILDEIHPFYADLMNVLYDRDHYKLALGQLNTARRLIDNISRDYVRLLKFGDSLYRCKQLKRAALGRMMKLIKRNSTSLAYLEEVRQHLSRLPSIDPNTRTLLITGYPNVGKSSFINKVTRADVDVQPFAFTTQSLFVGHMDYKYLRWQVIDSPGILDHPLEMRNTKEMQSITALAHLKAIILYFVDISEQCGYSIEQQVELFHNISPLFTGKPLLVVLNKIDVRRPEDLSEKEKSLIDSISDVKNVSMIPMSNFSEEGITKVKQTACDTLLRVRTEVKINSNIDHIVNRLHKAEPMKRDNIERPAFYPESVKNQIQDTSVSEAKFEEWQEQMRLYEDVDPDYKGMDWKKWYILEDDEWKYDKIPEIIDGMNIMDYWSDDLDEKLSLLEREEAARLRKLAERPDESGKYTFTEEQLQTLTAIRNKRRQLVEGSRRKKATDGSNMPIKHNTRGATIGDLEGHLRSLGVDSSAAVERLRSQSRGRKRKREDDSVERRQIVSQTPSVGSGYSNIGEIARANKIQRLQQRAISRDGRRGFSDRHVYDLKPKHLYSGKRGIGGNDRR
eukprot:TRINITY_DN12099_c0_g1_i1.p1 TRINITY_DN12099_c0_g1~~TRINITY_DN12099_c0_g1_i1.p1  ORF type:complete len:632 (-),score=152.94 TRINITY_DN12099_c0_g1_i1:116-2011(-)